ncbi:hypothetical protein PT974_11518 [Cladobotryum mycophilum]|uniref:BHLH domain-containing protein n=1 Tax=Cladobotryum mycophilum TaxID=491253 RepID=A0ABR0S6D5_9HYPO
MPQPVFPPTPGSSSDIKGKDGVQQLVSLQLSFELPPPAIHDADASRISLVDTNLSPTSSSLSSIYPMQAAEAVKSRRRSSAANKESKDSAFTLPPPPTRSRKIIQMKPRTQGESSASAKDSAKTSGGKASKDSAKASGATSGSGAAAASNQGKKKQPSATSAAGRKIARKTAHSLIERRRRSKMNEEFALLKSMIPACTGEMHKLAILQASIEYVRYLEDCVSKLQDQQVESQQGRPEAPPLPPIREFHPSFRGDDAADTEMTDSEAASPVFESHPPEHHQPSVSPALRAQDSCYRHASYSSVSTDQRHYSYSNSVATSPAFGPQQHAHGGYSQGHTPTSGSTLTSPALYPQTDPDQEATAALLMLNSDRRGTMANSNGRGLSVRDLLSS